MPTTTVSPTGGELDLQAGAPTVQIGAYPTGGELDLNGDGPSLVTGIVLSPTGGAFTLAADAPTLNIALVAAPDRGLLTLAMAGDAYGGGPVVDSYLTYPNRVRASMVG